MRKNIILILCIVVSVISTATKATASDKSHNPPEVKNIILMVGDGMGLAHVSAVSVEQGYKPLNLERAQYIGLIKTYSANNKVTDSAAAGTAFATGTKTNNGMIGMDANKVPHKSILEKAEENGMATGLVVTSSITDATPAAFIAHTESRSNHEDIADFFLKTEIDLFVGGGKDFFTQRVDKRDLTDELKAKGYAIANTVEEAIAFKGDKLCALLAPGSMPDMIQGRGDYLPNASEMALETLKRNSKNDKGFFAMIEGSKIDGGGHANDMQKVISETIDFDNAVKVAFDFADNNPGTLVVVVADHETGGLTIKSLKSSFLEGETKVEYNFSTKSHTGCFTIIYAYGTGAENFSRVLENTEIPKIMEGLLKLN